MNKPSEPAQIRNFAIIAHIDHGKSTLADRLIQLCGALHERDMVDQVLDNMDIERERGITIKSQCVTLRHTARDGMPYLINLVDTPGHVDFSYEVSRSLAACEGALLLVDASQGVEAQSVANCYKAVAAGLEVVPALNKMDLPQADAEQAKREIEEVIGISAAEACAISARTGEGVPELIEQLIARIPPPPCGANAPLRALIIDSWFDNYLGVVSLIRVVEGRLSVGDSIVACSVRESRTVDDLGVFTPRRESRAYLDHGEIGYVAAGIRQVDGAPVGDTLIHAKSGSSALPGFQRVEPKVYAGLFTVDNGQFEKFRTALAKLSLNDAALRYQPETSNSLGLGFRCGFLGTLHMEIVRERIEREYLIDLITTAPSVVYQVQTRDGRSLPIGNPVQMPDAGEVESILEPITDTDILTPREYLGEVLALCEARRGVQREMRFGSSQVSLRYELPMSEVAFDFFDRLKSVSKGFASLDYSFARYAPADLVRVDMRVNGERVDALTSVTYRDVARERGLELAEKLAQLIPRQMFDIAIQAVIGNRVIARKTVKALRKNVTAKCYGGDVTRKRKLLEKQKQGKRKMKQIGQVSIPQDAFLKALKTSQ